MNRQELCADVPALVAALRAQAEESRRLKAPLRRSWTESMKDAQAALLRCQRRTTELCILRAYLRGRYHLKKPLRAGSFPGMSWDQERYHRAVAERVAQDFPALAGLEVAS